MAEGLLDHDPAPLAVLFRGQARGSEIRDHDAEETVGDCEIEEIVASGTRRLVLLRQMLGQSAVGRGIVEVSLKIAHAAGQPAPGGLVDVVGSELVVALRDELVHHLGQALAPFLRGLGGQIDADEQEPLGQPLFIDQVIERGNDQALGQVAGGAEDDHRAGRRHRRAIIILRRVFGFYPVPLARHRLPRSSFINLNRAGDDRLSRLHC